MVWLHTISKKIKLLEAYSTINKSDVICLSESCKLNRSDHPNIVKRDSVCAYIRELLPVTCLSNTYLQECLILEISINNEKGYVVSLNLTLLLTI